MADAHIKLARALGLCQSLTLRDSSVGVTEEGLSITLFLGDCRVTFKALDVEAVEARGLVSLEKVLEALDGGE